MKHSQHDDFVNGECWADVCNIVLLY